MYLFVYFCAKSVQKSVFHTKLPELKERIILRTYQLYMLLILYITLSKKYIREVRQYAKTAWRSSATLPKTEKQMINIKRIICYKD